jgi:hypothetical protein
MAEAKQATGSSLSANPMPGWESVLHGFKSETDSGTHPHQRACFSSGPAKILISLMILSQFSAVDIMYFYFPHAQNMMHFLYL